MDASAALITKFVNASRALDGLEGSGRVDVSSVRFRKRGQLALLISQRGVERVGSKESIWEERMIGKWSLSQRSR